MWSYWAYVSTVSSALPCLWWGNWDGVASGAGRLPVYKWSCDLSLALTRGMRKVKTSREVFALLQSNLLIRGTRYYVSYVSGSGFCMAWKITDDDLGFDIMSVRRVGGVLAIVSCLIPVCPTPPMLANQSQVPRALPTQVFLKKDKKCQLPYYHR